MSTKTGLAALLVVLGLWACNQASSPEPTDVDHTQVADTGSTPGAGTTVGDTPPPGSRAGVDSLQLDTLNRNDTRQD